MNTRNRRTTFASALALQAAALCFATGSFASRSEMIKNQMGISEKEALYIVKGSGQHTVIDPLKMKNRLARSEVLKDKNLLVEYVEQRTTRGKNKQEAIVDMFAKHIKDSVIKKSLREVAALSGDVALAAINGIDNLKVSSNQSIKAQAAPENLNSLKGKEFARHAKIATSFGTEIFLADSYVLRNKKNLANVGYSIPERDNDSEVSKSQGVKNGSLSVCEYESCQLSVIEEEGSSAFDSYYTSESKAVVVEDTHSAFVFGSSQSDLSALLNLLNRENLANGCYIRAERDNDSEVSKSQGVKNGSFSVCEYESYQLPARDDDFNGFFASSKKEHLANLSFTRHKRAPSS